MERKCRFLYLFLGLFIGLLFFVNLGSYGLLEDNEARYFEIAWEMEESGDLVTPRLNYISHFHKPPATFWLVGLSLKCLGATEEAGRLPVVLAAITTVLLTTLFLPRGGQRIFAFLVLSCNLEFWLLSRTILTDMFLTLSVTACLLAAYNLIHEGAKWAFWLFWISLGFSALVKGPVGIAIVALTLLSYHLTTKKLPWKRWQTAKGLLVFSASTLPWYLLACSEYPGLFSYLAGYQTLERVATNVHGRGGPLWFFLPVVMVGFLPWSVLLPTSIGSAIKRSGPLDRYLLCWAIPSFILFSLSGSKLPTYILPLFPAFALLVAKNWDDMTFAKESIKYIVAVLALLGAASLFYAWSGVSPEIEPARSVIVVASLVCLGGSIVLSRLFAQGHFQETLGGAGVLFGLFLIVLSFGLHLSEDAYSSRHLATKIQARCDSRTVVAEYADHLHGLPYYLKRRLVQVSYPRETQFENKDALKGFLYPNLEEFLSDQPLDSRILIIVRRSDYSETLFSNWEIVNDGSWLLLERRPFQENRKLLDSRYENSDR